MLTEIRAVRQGKHFSVVESGAPESWDGKLFLGQALDFSGMEVSLNRFSPGQEVPFLHQHAQHEEMYLFIRGRGQFQVDGEIFEVGPGTVVRVAPDGKRAWRNQSNEDLYCIVVQANVGSLTDKDGIRNPDPLTWDA